MDTHFHSEFVSDPSFDSSALDAYNPLPHTPSYNGSYQNSPYSVASDLPDFEYKEHSLDILDRDPLVLSAREEYDPALYDAPSQSGGLLMFVNNDFLSSANTNHVAVTVTSALDDMHSPYYDHSSPASSNGAETDDRRSPASSVSSHPQAHPSPHINLGTLHVESPYLQSLSIHSDQGSPMVKPQSPPQLVIPDSQSQPAPAINAPEGDGVGPRLHIVPATPVSGGDAVQPGGGYGQSSLLGTQGAQAPTGSYAPANAGPPQYAPQNNYMPYAAPRDASTSALALSSDVAGADDGYLIPPSPSRMRSKSETSLAAPDWAAGLALFNQHQGPSLAGPDMFGARTQHHSAPTDALSLHDGGLAALAADLEHARPSSASALQTSFGAQPGAYGGHAGGGAAHAPFASFQGGAGGFLSPNMSVRRATSERGHGHGHHRQARSEDLRMFTNSGGGGGGGLFPPTAHQDFVNAARSQFLSPSSDVVPSIRGHHRRAASTTSSRERSLGGSPRVSPYPSPSASPAHRLEPLPNIAGAGVGGGSIGGGVGGGGMGVGVAPAPAGGSAVPKVNVTTSATAEASFRRRTNDAKFACPVPGCGSTFTRHFNLKGHLRSHNDEKPFQCKWPGCLKGFARQHDCKRHEQLHSNHRPFTCEGCKKPFARLDALNRHLRSEGGAGCAKANEGMHDAQGRLGDGLDGGEMMGGVGGGGAAGLDAWGSNGFSATGLVM